MTERAALCARPITEPIGTIESAALDEASGLVASRRHAGVLWSHNDGGEMPGVFAVGLDGADDVFHPLVGGDLSGMRVVDVEDIALVGGDNDGDDLLLADIGDNGANRDSIAVYRVPEPDPAQPGLIADASVLRYRYPGRPHNAETLLVDERKRTIVIVTKEQEADADGSTESGRMLASFVFEGPLDAPTGDPAELTLVGMLDAPALSDRVDAFDPPNPISLLGFGGVPTGGDVSADGTLVVLRTYEAAWLWERDPGRSVAETLVGIGSGAGSDAETDTEPCEVVTATERQGEAIAFVDDLLVTISEGASPTLHASSADQGDP